MKGRFSLKSRPLAAKRRKAGLVARLLVACVREPDRAAPPPEVDEVLAEVDLEQLLAAVDYHKVVGCVRRALRGLPPSELLWNQLDARYRMALGQHMRAELTLREAAGVLDSEGVRWLVLKGPVLEQVVYSTRRLRTYADLDLLVPRALLPVAVDALERHGMRCVDHNWVLMHELMASEVHLMPEFGTGIDLHWHLVFGKQLRRRFPFPMDAMIERAVPVEVAGVETRTLDPTDSILHLAVHAGIEGGDRLMWLKDLEQAVLHREPDWDVLVGRARHWNLQLQAGTMLARSRATLGTPVPGEVLRDLLPAAWRPVLRGIDRAFPAARSTTLGTPSTLVARSTRHSVPATVATAALGLGIRARGLVTGKVERVDMREDPSHPSSLYYPSGGRAERDAFLSAVAYGP